MSRRLVLLLACLALGFAPAPLPRRERAHADNRPDLDRIQGTWDIAERRYGQNLQQHEQAQVEITGRRWRFRFANNVGTQWNIELNPATSPRAMDFKQVGEQYDLKAIYRFDGDTLTVCYTSGNAARRPAQFASEPSTWTVLLKRPKR